MSDPKYKPHPSTGWRSEEAALYAIANELATLNGYAEDITTGLDLIDDRLRAIQSMLSTDDDHGNEQGVADVLARRGR
jgi:hypothetical protein